MYQHFIVFNLYRCPSTHCQSCSCCLTLLCTPEVAPISASWISSQSLPFSHIRQRNCWVLLHWTKFSQIELEPRKEGSIYGNECALLVMFNQSNHKTITFCVSVTGFVRESCMNNVVIQTWLRFFYSPNTPICVWLSDCIVLFDFLLCLYLALPFSVGSMAVTGGLIYNGNVFTFRPSSSIIYDDTCKAAIMCNHPIWFKFKFISMQASGNHQSDLDLSLN